MRTCAGSHVWRNVDTVAGLDLETAAGWKNLGDTFEHAAKLYADQPCLGMREVKVTHADGTQVISTATTLPLFLHCYFYIYVPTGQHDSMQKLFARTSQAGIGIQLAIILA